MSCTLLTSASVASPISLLLSPLIAGFCTEGFELQAFHHFVFHLIFLNISCIDTDNTQSQHFTVSIIWQYTSATHPVQEHPSQHEGQAGRAALLLPGTSENPCC